MFSELGILAVLWFTSITIYRLYFHPLAKYPGPFFAKITDWYNVYHCVIGDRHLEFYRIHKRYGNIVRYGPNRVSINSNTALKTIYSSKANVRKSSHFKVFTRFFKDWSTQTIIDTAKYNHPHKRKVLLQALNDHALKKHEAYIIRNVEKVCTSISTHQQPGVKSDQQWSRSIDMSALMGYLTFDIMGDICFGRSLGLLDSTENRHILRVISDGAQCLNTVGHMQWLLRTGIHRLLFRKLLKGLYEYKLFSKVQCGWRLQNGADTDHKDVFQHLVEARQPKKKDPLFTLGELESETSLLIIAGSDTTSTCLAATFFYLLHYPRYLELALREIRGLFNNKEEIRSGPTLSKCRYLKACIQESLRMSPPVGGLMPREVLPGGFEVDGHFFHEDTEIGTPHYALHHEELYFPDPFTYKPERWLVGSTDEGTHNYSLEDVTIAQSAFCAFSIGPRGCAGKSMAYEEMMIVLSRIIWEYEIRLQPECVSGGNQLGQTQGQISKSEYQLFDTFASRSIGPYVQFRSRTS